MSPRVHRNLFLHDDVLFYIFCISVKKQNVVLNSRFIFFQASIWERAAALTDSQHAAVDALTSICAQRPLPSHLADVSTLAAPTPVTAREVQQPTVSDTPLSPRTESVELSFAGTSFEDVVLQNSSEFYKWLSVLEAARATETESKYQRHAAVLDAHLTSCDDILDTIDGVLGLFASLKEGQRAVSDRTAALHVTCERLVNEREALVAAADALRSKLAYFDELERVAAQFHASSLSLDSTDVMTALQKLDESLAFVSSHPHYADAATYNVKFKQLQGRALAAVRSKVQQSLRAAAQSVQRSAADAKNFNGSSANGGGNNSGVDVGAETTLLYVRFRAAAEPALKALLQGIEARAGTSPEYARLLRDCQGLHCESRLSLMRPPVTAHLASLAGQPLPAVLRSGCAFLLHVAQLEAQLFEQLFPASAAAKGPEAAGIGTAAALAPLMDPLCSLLYDSMRPSLVALRDVDVLCELAYVLRAEILEDSGIDTMEQPSPQQQQQHRGEAASLLHPELLRVLGDIQERLTYRAQAFIRENVAGFTPAPADLDYPGILLKEKESTAGEGENRDDQNNSGNTSNSGEQYIGWYPPVQRSLLLLSKLYRTLPQKAFNGLAHEAVAAAAASVQEAARAVTKAAGPLHGQLFTIRQLLILREQIAPFEADFAVVERGLDFSHVKDYLRRTLSGQLPLFSFSSNSAVMQLVSRGGPRLSESQLDAKKDLERQLKATCEAFIMAVTKVAVDPALTFLTKVTAVRIAGGGADQRPLREQAFAAPERIIEVATAVRNALEGPLPDAAAALRAYLPAEQTRAALFKPIRSNVVEAFGQLRTLLQDEYSEEEQRGAGVPPIEQVEAALDAMA